MRWKDMIQGLSALALLCGWLAWVALVFSLMVAGDSFRLFSNFYWLVIGGRLFRAGASNDFIVAQFILDWILLMMFLMVGPLVLWMRLKRRKRDTKDPTKQ